MTKTRKIGTYVSKPYNASLVYNIRGRLLGTKEELIKNINEDVKKWCSPEQQLSHAFGFKVKLFNSLRCGDQTFYDIIKIYS